MLTLTSSPKPLAFIGNRPKFILTASGLQSSAGAVARYGIFLSPRFPAGGTITLAVEGFNFVFTKVASDPQWMEFSSAATLKSAIMSVPDLAYLFTVDDPADGEVGTTFYLVARYAGVLSVEISSSVTTSLFHPSSAYAGSSAVNLPNYSAQVALCTSWQQLPWMFLHPVNGAVEVSTEMLKSLFPAPELPSIEYDNSALVPEELGNLPLRYRLAYSERYGEQPMQRRVSYSDWRYMLDGEVRNLLAASGMPDWDDAIPTQPLSVTRSWICRVIGEDNNVVRDVAANDIDFLYLFGYNTGEAGDTSHTVTCRIEPYVDDSHSLLPASYSWSLRNGVMYRLPLAAKVCKLFPGVTRYSVVIKNPDGSVAFTRTYNVRAEMRDPKHFLFTGRHGLLLPFSSNELSLETTLEADRVKVADKLRSNVTARRQVVTVSSRKLRRAEAERLAVSLTGSRSYIYDGGSWQEIVVDADSFAYFNSDDNFTQFSFSFSFCSDNRINM